MSEPTQPRESELIERLRTEVRPKISIRAAAKSAGISDSRWHQIIKGYRQETKDVRVPVRAPAETLARMAKVVGATPDQLREAGRDDAAAELERLKTVREVMTHTEGSGAVDQTNLPPLDEPYASLLDTLDTVLRIAQDAMREPWVANSKEGLKTVAEAQNALTNFRTMLALEQLRRRDQHAAEVVSLRPTSDEDALDEALSAEDKAARATDPGAGKGRSEQGEAPDGGA